MINYRQIFDELTTIEEQIAQIDGLHHERLMLYKLRLKISDVLDALERKNPARNKNFVETISVDFDGVISQYKRGWEGPAIINDDPIPGAFEWLAKAARVARVVIFSARCNHPDGIAAMMDWFRKHGLDPATLDALIFEPGKPAWFVHIDDRNLRFGGSWGAMAAPEDLLKAFKPWYYNEKGWR